MKILLLLPGHWHFRGFGIGSGLRFTCMVMFFVLMVFTCNTAFCYVPDDLDFSSFAQSHGPRAKTIIVRSINYKMVYIKPGTFIMGSPSEEPERDDDETQHMVTLTQGFYMGVTEVTQAQWEKVMGNNPSHHKDCDDCPVEEVSWQDCQKFIKKLNRIEGTGKYRLPTEAEWEYACRAGTTTPFDAGRCLLMDQANYDGKHPLPGCQKGLYRGRTVPVASFAPNAWGLFDMHGNVWEWCQDWYGDYPSGHARDPEGPSSGSYRVFRGGSWNCYARGCRSASRSRYIPAYRGSDIGFRLTRTY